MPVIPLPTRSTVASSVDSGFSFSGPVSVSFSGEGADGVAAYLCSYLNGHLNLDCLAEPQEDAGSTEGAILPENSITIDKSGTVRQFWQYRDIGLWGICLMERSVGLPCSMPFGMP